MATTYAVAANNVHEYGARATHGPRAIAPNRQRAAAHGALAAMALVIAVGLGGCGTSSNLLNSDGSMGSAAQAPAQQAPVQVAKKIAIPDVIGAPEAVNREVVQHLGQAMKAQNLAISATGEKPDYTLRGYMVAAKERKGTKISYIWDLTDHAGNRLKRITGEEIAPKSKSTDPWSAITPTMLEKIAQSASSSVATAIPAGSAQPTSAPGAVVASNAPAQSTPANTTTGSIARQDRMTVAVIPVTGAKGDGNIALTQSMRKALASNGITVENNPAQAAYLIEGIVKETGQPEGNSQPVQVVWTVKDAQGNNKGGLQQDNMIDMATLNGKWGLMAEDAAAAAAQGLVKLLPDKQGQTAH